jgi:glycosyltransferase involved in cell wall biosynthesis
LLVEPGDTAGLAATLRTLMDEPARREELGRQGREAVHREYRDDLTAENVLKVYRKYVDNRTH